MMVVQSDLTSCCHAVIWNAETIFPFCLSVSSLELGFKETNRQTDKKKYSAGIEEDLCLIVSLRWTLGCPSPMCFSTTVPGLSSPSETHICMVVLWAPRSCIVSVRLTVGVPPVHSVYFVIGCSCTMTNRVAGGHPNRVFSVCACSRFWCITFASWGCCSLAWCIKQRAVLCGCAWAYNIALNVSSFRNFCCVHVTACAHYLQANDIGQIMRR